jgi:hypothetical protein
VALLLEMVDKCRAGRATLLQLHALDTALVDPVTRRRLAGDRGVVPYQVLRVDPALNMAVDRAVGDGLLALRPDATVELTDAGQSGLRAVRDADLLEAERAALAEIRGKLSQTAVRLAAGGAS